MDCGYSRDLGGIVPTRVRGRSVADRVLHAAGVVLLHPLVLGATASGFGVALALGSAGDAPSVRTYSVITGLVCIVATILQARFWWFQASPSTALDIRLFGWIAVIFSGEAPPLLRISTMLGVTMAGATGLLRLDLAGAAGATD